MTADIIEGTVGDDSLTGTLGPDTFALWQGGNDTARGLGGNDVFYFAGTFTAADTIDGGDGSDELYLKGDYSAGVTLASGTMTSVETILVGAGFSYALTTADATVASGQILTVDAHKLGAGNTLNFDGTAETNGSFHLVDGAGDDILRGGARADSFDISHGGHDTVAGGDGNDLISAGGALDAADSIDGGAGSDVLRLNGNYSAGLTLAAATLSSVETLQFDRGHSYDLTAAAGTFVAGSPTFIAASALTSANSLTFDGSASSANFKFTGGVGNDTLIGGSGADMFDLSRGGIDTGAGGDGNDAFLLGSSLTAADSIDGGAGADTVTLDGVAPIVFGPATMVNVETVQFLPGHSYSLATNNATVAAGAALLVRGENLGVSDRLLFDGSGERDGSFSIRGGAGDDILSGGALADSFNLTRGGVDVVHGNGGDDIITAGAALTAADTIDGGAGNDILTLDGDYPALVLTDAKITSVETLKFAAGHSYVVSIAGDIAGGATLTLDGSAIGAANTLFANLGAVTGSYSVTGGAGYNTFYLGAALTGTDAIHGGAGIDHVILDGDYTGAHALTLGTGVLRDIQVIAVRGGHSYDITAANGAFGPANIFPTTFTAFDLQARDNFTWNDSAETHLQDRVFATLGTYNLRTGSGNDLFAFGGTFEAANTLNGGGGADTVALNAIFQHPGFNAEYTGANALTFGTGQLGSVEDLGLTGGYSYDITMSDGNVAHGKTLTIEADGFSADAGGGDTVMLSALGAADTLTFDGAAETDGHFVFDAGAGLYHLTGGAQADNFVMGAAFTAADTIAGGGGNDALLLDGDYAGPLVFGAATMTGVVSLILGAGHDYDLATDDANVAAGARLTVDASALGGGNVLIFNGAAETDGSFAILGGAGNDVLTGGARNDIFTGGGGVDTMTGGGGHDLFRYTAASDSPGEASDVITDFDAARDTFHFPITVSSYAGQHSATLTDSGYAQSMNQALSDAAIHAFGAVILTAAANSSPDFVGHTYLVVDADGDTHFGTGDYVIDITNAMNLADFGLGNFQ